VKVIKTLIVLVFLVSPVYAEEQRRTFLFIGEPSAAAWKILMENPVDRREVVVKAFNALGGEMLSYYFGLGDGRNYIVVTLPDDNEIVQAIYLMRMPTGLLKSYEITELMDSAQMVEAMKKSNEFTELEKSMSLEGDDNE